MPDYLTEQLPGTGGHIKETCEDFLVEELPLYPACGSGEHLMLEVEKRGLTTFEMMRRLARALQVKERDMGYAGLKDAQATTRQFISVPGATAEQAAGLDLEGIRILSATRHRNKLRPGHLAGNRFTIRVRETGPEAENIAGDVLHILSLTGVPNFFGVQRYGVLGNSHLIGGALLRQDYPGAIRQIIGDPERITNPSWRQAAELFRAGDPAAAAVALPRGMRDEYQLLQVLAKGQAPEKAVLTLPARLLRLYLSAFQSYLFDRVIAMRLASLDILWPGDLAYKHDNGACFLVVDAAAEQPRADRLEISPSGPLFGYKMSQAGAAQGMLEQALLAKEALSLEHFHLGRGLSMPGERRPLRVPISQIRVQTEAGCLVLSFALPRGSYATSVLREIMKNPADNQQGTVTARNTE
jgi:tRNA pseudouridine13 synthase